MLSKDQIEILTDKYITKLYDDLEREVISDIARRVKKMERFTETAELQAMAMREQGYSPSKIQQQVFKRLNADEEYQKQLAENTKEYKQEIKKIIEETVEAAEKAGDKLVATAGDMAWNDDMQAWKKHGVDLKKPNGLKQLYAGITKQTNGDLKNITQSTGFKGTTLGTTGVLNAYRRTMDLATLKMSTGAFSYQTAVKDCVKMLADSGLRNIDYASGRSYQLDTAARMCIRTGMNQLAGKIMELNLQETSTPLVYVDAHAGARPEHAEWQGQVYAYDPEGELKDGSKAGDKYGNFFDETDYGSVTGLMGANCAHHFYPYWEGDPIPEYKEPDPIEIEGKEYTYYEATQEMRRQERNIRKTKRNIEAMNTLGEDTTELKKKGRLQEKAYLDFCKQAKINPRQYALTVPYGISKVPNQEAPKEPILNATAYSNDRIHYDKNASFKIPDLKYNDHVMETIKEAARIVAKEGDEKEYECGMLVGIETGRTTETFTDESTESVRIPGEKIEEMKGERYALVHNHLVNTPVSVGDAMGLLAYDDMHSSIAVRGNGESSALMLEQKGYQPFGDDDYFKAEEIRRKSKELTEVEKDSIIRDVIIKKSGMELFE